MRLNTEVHAQPEIFAPDAEESPITSMALIETTSAALVYAPGALTALVDKLKQEVRSQLATLDVSIPSQRARIVSLSARVASAKVKLDKLGDSLIEEHRAVVTAVNADRKAMRDDLDVFKVEVRKPVTDLENAEKERVAAHEAAIRQIEELGKMDRPLNLDEIQARAAQVSILADRDWQEFKQRATGAKVIAMESLSEAQDRALEAIRLREELERLRAAEAERAIKEREEAAARVAKEAAERRAEEQARIAREAAERERQRVENERAEAEARAKQAEAERIATEEKAVRELQEAEERRLDAERKAEQARIDAEKRAALELREAEIRAEATRRAEAEAYQAKLAKERREAEEAEERAQQALRDAEARRVAEAEAAELAASAAAAKAERERYAAVESERQRVLAQKKAEAEEAEKRAKNRAHQGAVHREILAALALLNISDEAGKLIIAAIAKGAVPHVSIQY